MLLIPNFFHSKDEGGSILQWQATSLYDLLLQRAAEGRQTVLYATELGEMGTATAAPSPASFRPILKAEI